MTDEQLQRIHDIEYSCDSREELAERIVGLEDDYAKLRACLGDVCADCAVGMGKYADSICDQIKAENEKLIVKLNAEHIARQNVEIENARMREELDQWERLTAGIELPDYPITQFQPKDLERDNTRLREENAKLREEAWKAWRAAERLCQAFDGPCRDDGTTIYKPCPMGERDEECVYGQLQRDLRELRVEVDG